MKKHYLTIQKLFFHIFVNKKANYMCIDMYIEDLLIVVSEIRKGIENSVGKYLYSLGVDTT